MGHLGAGADGEFASHGFIAIAAEELLPQARDQKVGFSHAQLRLTLRVWGLVWALVCLSLILLLA
jgi:hypothetical protein